VPGILQPFAEDELLHATLCNVVDGRDALPETGPAKEIVSAFRNIIVEKFTMMCLA
jgi:hypothetical protein